MSHWAATQDAFGSLLQAGLEPDILVNSAGVIIPGEFTTMSHEDFDRNVKNGFESVVNPCRFVAPRMVERGRGHIVNVSSSAGFLSIYGYTGYSAAKFAVMGFSESLRYEMKPHGVRVSVVCPSDTDTPALAHEKTLRPPDTVEPAGIVSLVRRRSVAEGDHQGRREEQVLHHPGLHDPARLSGQGAVA